VKVLVSSSSPYIFLFDRDNQTFTVYESSPTKVNDNYKTSFKLYYMFRFKFDLSTTNTRVVDVEADYIGIVSPNEFLVGFGLDYDERYRNLPYIGVLKEEIYS